MVIRNVKNEVESGDKIPLAEVEEAGAQPELVALYERDRKVYPRKVDGLYQRIRRYTGIPLLALYFVTPWLDWGDRQAVLFDLPARQFHILFLTFWPQDLALLTLGLMMAGFGLLFATTIVGRIYCGFTCPQTVWTMIFMWVERVIEGDRNKRIKLDASPWTARKWALKIYKHAIWLLIAFITGFTFVGFFTPIKELLFAIPNLEITGWALFWIAFFTIATYTNAGWMREQVCKYMCPYARFQSVMFDQDTLVVSYDSERGEPRGKKNNKSDGLGDCVDCELCVQVCPTDIDIREGLQYQCIDCARCIDACDSVMDKIGRDRGLIRFTTENNLNHKSSKLFRGRMIGYGSLLCVLIGITLYLLITRVPIELDVIRDRNHLYRITDSNQIENIFTIKIANMDQTDHTYMLSVDQPEKFDIEPNIELKVASGEVGIFPTVLRAQPSNITPGSQPVTFMVTTLDQPGIEGKADARFIAPTEAGEKSNDK